MAVMLLLRPPSLDRDDLPEIEKAVVIAALSAVAVELIQWGFAELKEAVKRKPKEGSTP